MKTLRSYVSGDWYEASGEFVSLHDPCSEEAIAQASTAGLDFGDALRFARQRGRVALRELTFEQRGELLQSMARALHAHRDELIALSLANTGTTRRDAKFDLDGATFTLSHYAELGRALGAGRVLADGDGIQLGRTARFWGQHVWSPLDGCAVHINAFNFPAWGFAEKAACSLLAGMPLISKPATSSAWVTERCMEILVEADVLPEGAVSLICGSTGDLLGQLGSGDVLAFTGSAQTALRLRGGANLLEASTRVNVEADSLNAAVLGPDVDPSGETGLVFMRDLFREMTQKSGQKCTAIRRVFVPADKLSAIETMLSERLGEVVVGNPQDESVSMGPLATRQQLDDACAGVALLREEADLVFGTGERVDGVGNPAALGFFFGPTLLRVRDSEAATVVHRHEVFGPVASLLPYDGSAEQVAGLVSRGGGSLVNSVYSNDAEFVGDFLAHGGSGSGRIYIGSDKVADQLPGSGLAMPHLHHGGPGRAGGGSELGGLRGLELYMQRVAVTGDRALVERLTGARKR